MTVDIDDAKKAEDRLSRSEAYLAEAQRLSHTGTAVFNDTTILYWSDETYRIFGFDPRNGLPSREAALKRSIPMTENGCRRRPGEGCARRETISSSTDSYFLQPSNISKGLLILSSQQAENLWRLSVQSST